MISFATLPVPPSSYAGQVVFKLFSGVFKYFNFSAGSVNSGLQLLCWYAVVRLVQPSNSLRTPVDPDMFRGKERALPR